MILPKKQLSMEESLFGFGGFLLEKLSVPMTVDELWKDYKKDYDRNGNAVKFSFDQYMGKWCEEREICYTRYCDDMTFSGKFDVREVKQKVRSYLQVLGFELNLKKTKVLKQYNRQSVTGIVVNEKAQVSKTYRRDVRQAVYYCGKYGVQEHLQRTGAQMWLQKGEERYLQHLMGKVNYILQVNPEDNMFQEVRKNLLRIQRQCKGGKL